MSADILVDNGLCRLAFSSEPAGRPMLERLLGFLAPVFRPAPAGGRPHARIEVRSFAEHREALCALAREEVVFRRSSCPEYNLRGAIGRDESGAVVAVDLASGTGYRVSPERREVTFYGTPGLAGSAIHLHDFTRYLALLVCEAEGATLLHASAVTLDDRLILVLGDKGAGKTTTMLRLVAAGGRYFSGDKVLARVAAGRLLVGAWPDVPYIGVGSLRHDPGLAGALGFPLVDERGLPLPPRTKQLVDPALFRDTVPQSRLTECDAVAAVVLPDVGAPRAGVRWVPDGERAAADLTGLVEWPHDFLTARWHGLYRDEARSGVPDGGRAVLDALARVPWVEVKGDAALPARLTGQAGARPAGEVPHA